MKRSHTIIFVGFIFLAACSPVPEEITAAPRSSETPIPSSTATSTPIPTSNTPIATEVPIPTLEDDEREELFLQLLTNDRSCQFPCWWDIEPGLSTVDELQEFVTYSGATLDFNVQYPDGTDSYSISGFNFAYHAQHGFTIYARDKTVVGINIRASDYSTPDLLIQMWKNYSPKAVLAKYGKPSRVSIQSFSPRGEEAQFIVWIFYDELGALIRYTGFADTQEFYRICPFFGKNGNLEADIQIELFAINKFQNAEEFIELRLSEIRSFIVKPINVATGITVDEFYDLMLNDEAECFETPKNIWP